MGEEIKRVRQTINYLHTNSPNLICVVNTTGTPYYEKQPLKDVVIWYGLSQGIGDGILKDVADNIQGYTFDAAAAGPFVREIVRDFFATYADVWPAERRTRQTRALLPPERRPERTARGRGDRLDGGGPADDAHPQEHVGSPRSRRWTTSTVLNDPALAASGDPGGE